MNQLYNKVDISKKKENWTNKSHLILYIENYQEIKSHLDGTISSFWLTKEKNSHRMK